LVVRGVLCYLVLLLEKGEEEGIEKKREGKGREGERTYLFRFQRG